MRLHYSFSKMGYKRVCILSLLCGLMCSCMEDIDLDTGERILNVYCVLGEGPEQELELSYIAPTGGTSQPVGEGTSVTLLEEGSPVGQFVRVSETKWKLDFSPKSGRTYRLEVKIPGEETLTAETSFPPAFALRRESVVVLPPEGVEVDATSIPYFGGFELETDKDLILWLYFERQNGNTPITYYIATDHPGADKRGETICPFDRTSPLYKFFFRGRDIDYSGHVFFSEFSDEPAMLHENAIRIVHPAGFSRPLDNKRMRVFRLNENYLPAEEMKGETDLFGIGGVCTDSKGREAFLGICSTSEEYDKYLSDYYYTHPDTDDFTQAAYKRNYYSNVQNGTGIFGACYTQRMKCVFYNPRNLIY